MKKKTVMYTETAYVLGVVILALGTAFMALANFGVSMVVAPAYILYLKISEFLPFFTFGMAEYMLQACIIVVMMLILGKFKVRYLLSFVTTIFYGLALDGFMLLLGNIPADTIIIRIIFYIIGVPLCSVGVAFMFRTKLPPAAYEMFVAEVSKKFGANITKFKTCYDLVSCVVAILMSFIFFGFGSFNGINIGTVICAFLNGPLIGIFGKLYEKNFEFKDKTTLGDRF